MVENDDEYREVINHLFPKLGTFFHCTICNSNLSACTRCGVMKCNCQEWHSYKVLNIRKWCNDCAEKECLLCQV